MSMFMFGLKKVKDCNVSKINTRANGWDATFSGWWLDLKLAGALADHFNAKVGTENFRKEAQ